MENQKQTTVVLKNIRVSPQKLNLVAKMIRRMDVNDAINALKFSPKRVSDDVLKAVRSAVANAEFNHAMDVDNLYIKEAHVGKGTCMRRFSARGRSRSGVIRKLFSRISIVVEERETMEEKN